MTTTKISIERIATGTIIEVPGFGAAEVYGLQFDGDSYSVTYCTDDRGGWDSLDVFGVACGDTVEALDHQTFLRADKDISIEEWEAKIEANSAAIAEMLSKLPVIHADTAAMQAEMFGLPALQAAE